MKKNELSYLLERYILNESGLSKVFDDMVIAAKTVGGNWDAFANVSKTLAKYGDDAADLQYALSKAGKSVNVEDVLRTVRNATSSPADASKLSSAVAKARALEKQIKEAEQTADFASDVLRGAKGADTVGGGSKIVRGAGEAAEATTGSSKTLTRADFLTQEGFDLHRQIQRLEKLGASEAQLAGKRAQLLKAEGLSEVVDAKEAFRIRMKDLDEEIALKKSAGAIEDAQRLERLKRKEAGGTRYERLKLWIKQNPKKAILLGLSAAYLGYLGFTTSSKGEVKPSPTPGPAPSPGGGGGGKGGGTKWKECEDLELKRGCKGDNVRVLQSYLNNMGYDVSVDAKFGSNTEKGLKQFQKDFGLPATGKVNQATLDKIDEIRIKGVKKVKQTPTPDTPESNEKKTTAVDVPATEKDKEDFSKAKIDFEKAKKERDEMRKRGEVPDSALEVKQETLIRRRNDQIEKLVFERLVKGCK